MENIIYEKRYPREDAEGIEALSKTLDKETEETQQIPTFEEFLRRVYENQVCILIPERQRLAENLYGPPAKCPNCIGWTLRSRNIVTTFP